MSGTVLIIEDDNIQREMLTTELRQQGFTVATATDGSEAVSQLSRGLLPQLILLDMLIPTGHCDGWWFLQQRERMPELAAVPVIILTSLSVASKAWAASLGAAGLIRKPCDPAPLIAEVERCLSSISQG